MVRPTCFLDWGRPKEVYGYLEGEVWLSFRYAHCMWLPKVSLSIYIAPFNLSEQSNMMTPLS